MEQTSLFATDAPSIELARKPSSVVVLALRELKRPREREVLIKRHSLDGRGKRILEEIGKEYHITRERVRQIEKSALTRLREITLDDGGVMKQMVSYLTRRGGLSLKQMFIDELLGGQTERIERDSLEFLALLNENVKEISDENLIKESYALAEIPDSLVFQVAREYISALETAKKIMSTEKLLAEGAKTVERSGSRGTITRSGLLGILAVTKPIISPEPDYWGLSSWREINPRSIKDKTYFILKKTGKPLHFAEIADEIRTLSAERKSVTKQAVHNELIRDSRFVLIGRGIYALSEWGYSPGTVSDVIVEILKDRSPLHKNEIVSEVLKKRKVKEATIILNLQNKDRFMRVAKATYTLQGGN